MTNPLIEVLQEFTQNAIQTANLTELMLGTLVIQNQEIHGIFLIDSGIVISKSMIYINSTLEQEVFTDISLNTPITTTVEQEHSHQIPEHEVLNVRVHQEYNTSDLYLIAKINQGQQFIILCKVKSI